MRYEFGDVVLIRFPFTNHTTFKQRPAVVVSSRVYNLSRPDVVITAITTQLNSPSCLGEVRINQWQIANLLKPSAIKPVLATLEQNLILKKLGVLDPSDPAALRQAIAALLG
jgi:mRNA interferase MazF